jgi:superfamily II DNA helicase RecQ
LVLENRLDLLVVMPTGHGKSVVFMILAMVAARTVIVVATPLWAKCEGE